jgi:hypothetical protein
MAKKSGQYPDLYGSPTKALPDILGPLNIDEEGDKCVPRNDMNEFPRADGTIGPDPIGLFIKGGK